MARVVTVTANPCIDHIVEVESFAYGAVNRAVDSRREVGGKGINTARILKLLGVDVLAAAFLGGDTGREISSALEQLGVKYLSIGTKHPTRTNIKIINHDAGSKTVTELNEPGRSPAGEELEKLIEQVEMAAVNALYLVLSGSLPQGCPPDFYQTLLKAARRRNPKLTAVVDTSGEPLRRALEAKPEIIKPNHSELAELVGCPLTGIEDVFQALKEIHQQGVKVALCSLGADGAAAVSVEGCYRVTAPKVAAVNTVGCGDAFVAGLIAGLLQRNQLESGLTAAAAAGTAAALDPGTGFHSLERWDDIYSQVVVTKVKC